MAFRVAMAFERVMAGRGHDLAHGHDDRLARRAERADGRRVLARARIFFFTGTSEHADGGASEHADGGASVHADGGASEHADGECRGVVPIGRCLNDASHRDLSDG